MSKRERPSKGKKLVEEAVCEYLDEIDRVEACFATLFVPQMHVIERSCLCVSAYMDGCECIRLSLYLLATQELQKRTTCWSCIPDFTHEPAKLERNCTYSKVGKSFMYSLCLL